MNRSIGQHRPEKKRCGVRAARLASISHHPQFRWVQLKETQHTAQQQHHHANDDCSGQATTTKVSPLSRGQEHFDGHRSAPPHALVHLTKKKKEASPMEWVSYLKSVFEHTGTADGGQLLSMQIGNRRDTLVARYALHVLMICSRPSLIIKHNRKSSSNPSYLSSAVCRNRFGLCHTRVYISSRLLLRLLRLLTMRYRYSYGYSYMYTPVRTRRLRSARPARACRTAGPGWPRRLARSSSRARGGRVPL